MKIYKMYYRKIGDDLIHTHYFVAADMEEVLCALEEYESHVQGAIKGMEILKIEYKGEGSMARHE